MLAPKQATLPTVPEKKEHNQKQNHDDVKKQMVAVGLTAAREKFEANATQPAKWTTTGSLSCVYSRAAFQNVIVSNLLRVRMASRLYREHPQSPFLDFIVSILEVRF